MSYNVIEDTRCRETWIIKFNFGHPEDRFSIHKSESGYSSECTIFTDNGTSEYVESYHDKPGLTFEEALRSIEQVYSLFYGEGDTYELLHIPEQVVDWNIEFQDQGEEDSFYVVKDVNTQTYAAYGTSFLTENEWFELNGPKLDTFEKALSRVVSFYNKSERLKLRILKK